MTQYLNPFSGSQFVDANGAPYSGAQLFIYAAGSTSKVTTTKDQAGSSNHTNPIVLSSKGEIADGSGNRQPIWQPGATPVKMVLAPSNDTDPPTNSYWSIDNVYGINDASSTLDQWIAGPTPTYIGATQFSLVGDQTSTFHVGRRIKASVSAGTVYGTITVSAFTTLTTITVAIDSGALDSGLSAISYGLLSSTNPSIPGVITIPSLQIAGTFAASQRFDLSGDISPAQLTGNQNDWAPTGLSTASVIRIDTDAQRNITGLTGGADGRLMVVHYIGSTSVVLVDESASSTAANRFAFSGDITLYGDDCCILQYDSTSSRWRAIGRYAVYATSCPQGRLTLQASTPVMVSSQSAQTTIRYTPYIGKFVPIYDGTKFVMSDTGGELSQATTDSTKSPAAVAQEKAYDMFVWSDSGTMRCTRGPAWSYAATITMTIATPAVVSWTAHGLKEGDPVVFTTTGALPTGITAGTTYYVSRSPAADTFNVSTSVANAAAGTRVSTSGSQSGTHTGTNGCRSRGTGAGTTELTLLNGIYVNANSITNGPAANRGTYVGTVYSNASSQIDYIFGALAANGTAASFGVWNMYNRVSVSTFIADTTNSWTYNVATMRPSNNSTTMRASFIRGLDENAVYSEFTGLGNATTNPVYSAVGLDSTSVISGSTAQTAVTGTNPATMVSRYSGIPGLGLHYLQALEAGDTGTGTLYGDNGTPTLSQNGLHVLLTA